VRDIVYAATEPDGISRCLRAGVVPDAYAGSVTKAEVREVRRKVVDVEPDPGEPYGTPAEMEARAAEGYCRTAHSQSHFWSRDAN
jgi:transposase